MRRAGSRGRARAGRGLDPFPAVPHVAWGDCEAIRPGLIGQPANTMSSLAFVAAAVPIARQARRPGRAAWRWVAAASAFEGLGSVAYHGPGGRLSKAVHDVGLVALAVAFGAVAREDPAALRPRPLPSLLGLSAAALHALSRTGRPLCSCRSRLQGHAFFHALAAAALVAAADHRICVRQTSDGAVSRTQIS